MNPFEFVIAIVFIVIAGRIIQSRMSAQRDRHPADDGEQARTRDEIRLLKERIQVLERVVTETHASHDLDREIERLRDRQSPSLSLRKAGDASGQEERT
jgi:hypothetical protein